jgi:hypothetical protein
MACAILPANLLLFVSTWAAEQAAVQAMLKELGSPSFQRREAATKWLLERPQAAGALRAALSSPDPEVKKRAGLILDHFARRPIRDLQAAIKDGNVERFIAMLNKWPKGQHEEAAWECVGEFTRTLLELHGKKGGGAIQLPFWGAAAPPLIISAQGAKEETGYRDKCRFLRTGSLDIAQVNFPPPNGSVIIASQFVRIRAATFGDAAIFARGPVEIFDGHNIVIVSCDDVTVNFAISNALVIASGKVTCKASPTNCRIISGKSVICNRQNASNCIITENELRPLGLIRFPDVQKKP